MYRRRYQLVLRASLERSYAVIAGIHCPPRCGVAAVRPGVKYCRRERGAAHYGRLIDCQWPVLFVLRELLVAPWPILRVYYRYRLEPDAGGTRVVLDTRVRLFPPGRLRPRAWRSRVERTVTQRLVRIRLAAARGAVCDPPAGAGANR